jgi:hypothetical protein
MAETDPHGNPAPKTDGPFGNFLGIPIVLWGAIIAIIPSTITAFISGNVGYNQGVDSGFKKGVDSISPPVQVKAAGIDTDPEESEINRVKADIVQPSTKEVGNKIECSGTIINFKRGKQHLWLAIEVNGYLWFKRSKFDIDDIQNTWSATIEEGGEPKTMSLLLYVMNDKANREILDWLEKGEKMKRFDPVTSIGKGAIRLDHRDFLEFKGKP